jgi:hypothetical protein
MSLVAHCGGTTDGAFLHTFTLTDTATTWTVTVTATLSNSRSRVDGSATRMGALIDDGLVFAAEAHHSCS